MTDPHSPGLRFRSMESSDLGFVVGQHLHHFPEGFFARLGAPFLGEYYRAFLTGRHARTRVAVAGGEPVGFLVGVTNPAGHREHVVARHGRALALRASAGMLARPWLAVRFLRTRAGLYARKLLRPLGPAAPARDAARCSTAVLAHVAVTPSAQSRGIGSALVEWFEREVAAAGCERLTLVTASGEDGAGPYYRRRGWQAVDERTTPDGLCLTAYERPVHPRPAEPDVTRSEDRA